MEKKLAQKDREVKEDNLRQLAQKARDERAGIRTADAGNELGSTVCERQQLPLLLVLVDR